MKPQSPALPPLGSDLYVKRANKTCNSLEFFSKQKPAGKENLGLLLGEQF